MKKMLIALVVVALPPTAAVAKDNPDKIPVFVKSAAAAAGFTDPSKDRQDSVKDLLNRLKDSDVVRIVQSERDAVAILEVLDRGTKREVNFFGAQNKSLLAVRLTAGDYSTEFQGESGSSGVFKDYRGAAKSVVKQLENWVKTNRAKLVAVPK